MPTTLSSFRKPPRPAANFAVKCAMVVSILLLGALVQVTEQAHYATPHQALTAMTATIDASH